MNGQLFPLYNNKYHVFYERGLMLPETAAQDIGRNPQFHLIPFTITKMPGWKTRLYQLLHILVRPFSLPLSAYFAARFNSNLVAPVESLKEKTQGVGPHDVVLFLNPSMATAQVVDALSNRTRFVNLYFLDPVHRLGLDNSSLAQWRMSCRLLTYSAMQAKDLHIEFLAPYEPDIALATESPIYDLVYVGSPSPKRLAWVLYLKLRIAAANRSSHLRLATGNDLMVNILPWLFCRRMTFTEYIELCRLARGILELHERDAEGVTVRTTLCQALGRTHVCNLRVIHDTVKISPPWNSELKRFLSKQPQQFVATHAELNKEKKFDRWLGVNFPAPVDCEG